MKVHGPALPLSGKPLLEGDALAWAAVLPADVRLFCFTDALRLNLREGSLMTWIDRMRKRFIDITARHRITRSHRKHTNMKLKDWYDFVPACVCTFGVLSISRTLGLLGAQRAFDAGRPPAQTSISISVWSFDGTPKALKVVPDHLVAPPTPRFVVAYVPAVTSVGEALRLLDLPD